MMRTILLLSLLVACDHKPSPPSPAPATSGSGSATAPAPRPPLPRPTSPPVQPTAECEQAAIKYADLMIASADASQKPALEIERATIVRKTEVACTEQQWPHAALACIGQSRTDVQARACLDKVPSGSGSAAPEPRLGSAAPH